MFDWRAKTIKIAEKVEMTETVEWGQYHNQVGRAEMVERVKRRTLNGECRTPHATRAECRMQNAKCRTLNAEC